MLTAPRRSEIIRNQSHRTNKMSAAEHVASDGMRASSPSSVSGAGTRRASVTSSSSSSSTRSAGKVRLKKELRLFEAVSVIVGLIIGTGMS